VTEFIKLMLPFHLASLLICSFDISPELLPFIKEEKMLIEFSIVPIGSGSRPGDGLA